ncbi:MAG TPA: alpha/beta fold hydrolase [Burkholderiales bacterium]|nr:alpha/beta fold hydrolase [Burkholderiales bacterium]
MTRFITFALTLLLATAAHGYLPPKGVEFELVEFSAGGKTLQGGLFVPDSKRFAKPLVGVVLVHGVESYWYEGPPMFLAGLLAEQGYAALAYNGAHSGESFRTSDFETAVREVGAAISYMKSRGYQRIALAGHSLGTPIVEYYQGAEPDPAVKALAVYGPHINIPAITRDSLLGPELYEQFRAECRALVASGKGDEIKLLPYREGRVIITSAKTFLSYRDIDTSKAAVEKMIQRIRVPLLIVYDPADNIQGKGGLTQRETLVAQIKANAVAAPRADIVVIPSTAETSPLRAHRFVGNERLVAEKTVQWLQGIGLPPAAKSSGRK